MRSTTMTTRHWLALSLEGSLPLHQSPVTDHGSRAALTGEDKAAILTGDDWTSARALAGEAAKPSNHGCGRRGIRRGRAPVHLCGAGGSPRGSDPADPHARARRHLGALWISFRARKTFFRVAAGSVRSRPFSGAENSFGNERRGAGPGDSRRRPGAADENSRRGAQDRGAHRRRVKG